MKRELKTKTTYGYRCDERLKTNVKESTRLAYTPLVNLSNTNKLKDTKGIHDVVFLLSKDDRTLSEAQVKSSVDNYKVSLNRKKKSEKDTDPKDKNQE